MTAQNLTIPLHTRSNASAAEDQVRREHTADRRLELAGMADKPLPYRANAFEWIEGEAEAIDAFRRLLLSFDRYQDVLRFRKLCSARGTYRRAVHGLAALACYHRRWIRTPETWLSRVPSKGEPQAIEQFTSLARHLLTHYDVPTCLDEVWFLERNEEALRRQEWFLHIAAGGSVRDLDLPVKLTRRMAHQFMKQRNRDSIEHNLRWAQVLGVAGDNKLARTVLSTRLGRHLEHDDFWQSVVLFLATNPLIEPAHIGPMIDYVHNMKFAPRRVVAEGGGVEEAPPPQPNFTMKGRSAIKLLRDRRQLDFPSGDNYFSRSGLG